MVCNLRSKKWNSGAVSTVQKFFIHIFSVCFKCKIRFRTFGIHHNIKIWTKNFTIPRDYEGGGGPDPFIVKDYEKGPFFCSLPLYALTLCQGLKCHNNIEVSLNSCRGWLLGYFGIVFHFYLVAHTLLNPLVHHRELQIWTDEYIWEDIHIRLDLRDKNKQSSFVLRW